MAIDNIVAEVRQVREAYAERFGYDIYAMWRDLEKRQRKSGRRVVSLSPKRINPDSGTPRYHLTTAFKRQLSRDKVS